MSWTSSRKIPMPGATWRDQPIGLDGRTLIRRCPVQNEDDEGAYLITSTQLVAVMGICEEIHAAWLQRMNGYASTDNGLTGWQQAEEMLADISAESLGL